MPSPEDLPDPGIEAGSPALQADSLSTIRKAYYKVRKKKVWYWHAAATAAKSFQSCPTLCDPLDSSPPGSAVPGILQARTLEWVAISFSSA